MVDQQDLTFCPKNVTLSKAYDREKKNPKTLFQMPIDYNDLDINENSSLKKYNLIFAIDTSYNTGGNQCVSFWAESKFIEDDKCSVSISGPIIFEKGEIHPEKIALIELIHYILQRSDYKSCLNIGIITDHDLGNITKYNLRELPIIENTKLFLPDGFTLIYACDKPAKKSIANFLLNKCDKFAKEYLRKIQN